MQNIFTSFKGVQNYGDSLETTQLEANLISYFNWGFLNIGAFQNVYKGDDFSYVTESSPMMEIVCENSAKGSIAEENSAYKFLNAYGAQPAILRPVTDPNFVDGTVFEGFRQDWVWEQNLDYPIQPIAISGVYVDNNFVANANSGQYSFNINYPAGRVVFNIPITGSPQITCEYSFRHVRIDLADSPWFQKVQFDSYRVNDPQFLMTGSGLWNTLAQNRIQLPAIIIQPILDTNRIPYEIGDHAVVHSQRVRFDILAETDFDRKQISDILITQQDNVIQAFDKDVLLDNNQYPLNPYGYLSPTALTYKQILASYPWKSTITFKTMDKETVVTEPPLYRSKLTGSFDLYLP